LCLRERFASIQNKCHLNSNEQSRLTEVNTASAIWETPRIFFFLYVYRRVRSIPPLCLLYFSPWRQTETCQNTKIILWNLNCNKICL
jgi:hypothetical protein